MSVKSSKIEMDKRIRMVQEWMMQGHSTADIVRNITSKWDVTERQAFKYIHRAYVSFREVSEKNIENRRHYHLNTRLKLYRDLKGKEFPEGSKAALSILQDIAKLEGLYVEKTEIVFNEKQRIAALFPTEEELNEQETDK